MYYNEIYMEFSTWIRIYPLLKCILMEFKD